jgi:hypothetical protein
MKVDFFMIEKFQVEEVELSVFKEIYKNGYLM